MGGGACMAVQWSRSPNLKMRFAIIFIAAGACLSSASAQNDCKKPLYLTFDTGHMEVAPLVADVLSRQQVRVTFFAANERTKVGDGSLGEHWALWWRARAAEGHEFASHTWDHTYWRADLGTVQVARSSTCTIIISWYFWC